MGKLLPCPFCGGEAVTKWMRDSGWLVKCQECSARMTGSGNEVEQHWNHRVALFNQELGLNVVTCKTCRHRDTELCRCRTLLRYDLKTEKKTWKTLMDPDDFCSIGEQHSSQILS